MTSFKLPPSKEPTQRCEDSSASSDTSTSSTTSTSSALSLPLNVSSPEEKPVLRKWVRDRPPKVRDTSQRSQLAWEHARVWPTLSSKLTRADLASLVAKDPNFVERAYKEATGPLIVENGREWHAFHSFPEEEVILQSSDDVFFRASAHHLRNASERFRKLLDDNWTPPWDITQAEKLPFPQVTISKFLDLCNSCQPGIPTAWYLCDDLLAIAKYTISPDIARLVTESLVSHCDPFDFLVIAGHYHDVELAKVALKRISDEGGVGFAFDHNNPAPLEAFHRGLARLPSSWAIHILRYSLVAAETPGDNDEDQASVIEYHSLAVKWDWSTIAETFRP